ncbi:hypothetical protein FACS1894123_10220 [Bacteroidia bacterium]|nr:hypothetical protein FACS1894123_10220 [Bacteroidia bacterium]
MGLKIDDKDKDKFDFKDSGLSATPTILINGYKLPVDYRIEDIVFFLKELKDRFKKD